MPNIKIIESSKDDHFQVAIPLISTQNITQFSGTTISRYAGKIINGIIDQYPQEQDRIYITQRPGISLQDDASNYVILYYTAGTGTFAVGDTVTSSGGATGVVLDVDETAATSILTMDTITGTFAPAETLVGAPSTATGTINANGVITPTIGRGIYYWSATSTRYIANSRGVYKSDYESVPCRLATSTGTPLIFAAGTEKIYFIEWTNSAGNAYLFIVDPEGNKMYYIDSAASTVVLECTGSGSTASGDSYDFTDLPPNQSPALSLTHGVEILDQYMFLGATNGTIWNSAVGDLLNWSSALDYISAEREPDGLLYITKSRDHLIGFGQKTIEIFYDAANPSPGSPLTRRPDIFWNTGIVNGECSWRDGDDVWFLGTSPHGDFNFYKLGGDFSLTIDSPPSLNSYFRNASVATADTYKLSGFSTGKHTYAMLTSFNSSNVPSLSLAFDSYSGLWSEWQTQLRSHTLFPMIGVTIRTTEEFVNTEGLFSNGDVFTIRDDLVPLDMDNSSGYFLEDYDYTGVDSYDTETGEITLYQIDLYSIVSNLDAGTPMYKYMNELTYFGSVSQYASTLDVKFSSDNGRTWGTTYSLDATSLGSWFRLGRFRRYDMQTHYKFGEQMRLESIIMLLTKGTGT